MSKIAVTLILGVILDFHCVLSAPPDLQNFDVCKDHYATSRVKETMSSSTQFHCYFRCGQSKWCRALTIRSFPGWVECRLHDAMFNVDCTSFPLLENQGYKLLLKKEPYVPSDDNGCKNGGTYTGGCACYGTGFAGTYCERYVYDCVEAKLMNPPISGFQPFMIKPPLSSRPFEARCNVYGFAIMLIRNHQQFGVEFNRTLEDYKYAFGISLNYWLGLENMYAITNQAADFRMQVYCENVDTSAWFSLYYRNFKVGSATNYGMTTGLVVDQTNMPEPSSDGLGQSRSDVPFCTYDKPCNGYPNNIQGGWWYVSGLEKYALTNPLSTMMFKYRGADFQTHKVSFALEMMP